MNPNKYAEDFNMDLHKSPITNIQVPPIEIKEPSNGNPGLKKKNRTLQFFKFLFYSMKVEIKVHEFFDLVRFSNQSEISLWIVSVVLLANTPTNYALSTEKDESNTHEYANVFIWIHIVHLIRGVLGFLLMLKLPRSFKVVQAMKEVPEKEIENKLFNDIARDVIKKEVVTPLQGMRGWLIVYFVLTFLNFVFDVIDFLVILSNLDKAANNVKVVLLTYLMIAFLYLGIIFLVIFFSN
jgi:hypothetical protein